MLSNVFNKTQALYITAAILGMMGMIPGMPNLAFLLLAGGMVWLAWKNGKRQQAVEAAPDVQTAPVAGGRIPGSQLGRRCAHRHPGAGSRLSPDPAGRQRRRRRTGAPHQGHPQEIRPRNRFPAAGRAYPRQPRNQSEQLPHHLQGRGDRQRRSAHRAVSCHRPGQRHRQPAGRRHHGSRVRPAGGMDRIQSARTGAGHGLHRGRSRHRGRHSPESSGDASMPPNCSAARKRRRCSTIWARARPSWWKTWCRKC